MIIDITPYLPEMHRPAKSAGHAPHGESAPAESDPQTDRVEFTQNAQALADSQELSSFRLARVNAIRAEIQAGTYETPERIAGTVSRLIDVVG